MIDAAWVAYINGCEFARLAMIGLGLIALGLAHVAVYKAPAGKIVRRVGQAVKRVYYDR